MIVTSARLDDYTDRPGASALKARIEAYWRERGFDIQVMLVEGAFSQSLRCCRMDVRSDLVNGLPRQALRAAAPANLVYGNLCAASHAATASASRGVISG